jgi:hypothetical protein
MFRQNHKLRESVMNKIAITKLAFFLTILFALVFYFYNVAGVIGGVTALAICLLMWVIYCHVENKYLGKKVEEYISYFSNHDSSFIENFDKHGEFYLKGKNCDGWVNFDSSGVSLKINSLHTIPWNHISRFTVLNIQNSVIVRLFLIRGKVEESKLFVPWEDCFLDRIPANELKKLQDNRK